MIITTSKKPGRKTRAFCRELSLVLPTARYILRGKKALVDVINMDEKVLVIDELKGNPSRIRVFINGIWKFSILIKGVQLQHELLKKRISLNAFGSFSRDKYLNIAFGEGLYDDLVEVKIMNNTVGFYYDNNFYPPYFKIRRIKSPDGTTIKEYLQVQSK